MKKWQLKENKTDEELIKNNPDINPVILQLLFNRGLSIEQLKKFLEPDYQAQLHNPFLFKDMRAAVDLVNSHLAAGAKITIYGDYDADGVTATAVIFKTLNFLIDKNKNTSRIDIYIPHRETEGYGMNKDAVEEIAENGTKLIITVDTGVRSIDEVSLAKERGVDVILTDHHESGEQIPNCLIINPKIKGDTYPFRDLAGVGVAFKLTQALLQYYLEEGKINGKEKEAFEKWLLDLVAIGTVADLVPLVDENRILVNYGLVVLNKTKIIGVQKLIEIAQSAVDKNGNKKEIDAWQIGYQLAPRLNAAGRLGHANTAYELLITQDEREAIKIAQELNETNKRRQEITQEIFEQADRALTAEDKNGPIVFAICPRLISSRENEEDKEAAAWPAGVMGLVAGKLTEKYYRPSLAITEKDAGAGKEIIGSARSISEFNITAMLDECAEFLAHYGGHKQAAGFSLIPAISAEDKKSNLKKFLAKAKEIAEKKLKDIELIPGLEIDLEINLADVTEKLHEQLQQLRPFGVGNPQPKFLSKSLKVMNVVNMGADSQHIKLKVKSEKLKVMDAIAFSVVDKWKEIKINDTIDLVYYIDINEWNGKREVQLKIIDLKSHST